MRNLRKAFASLSVVAILSSLVVTSTAFAGTFKDVPADAYYYSNVEALVEAGVVTANENFHPTGSLERQQAAKLIVEAAGLDTAEPAVATFVDVPKTLWSFKYVEGAVAANVASGYADRVGYFGPTDAITREQFAKMAVEAFDLPEYVPAEPTFPDVTEGMWSYKYIETAYHYQVVNGMADGTFAPTKNINRADGAMMTGNAMNASPRTDDGGEEEPVEGDLDADLSEDAPEYGDNILLEEGTTPFRAEYRPLVALYTLTAGDEDVEVEGLEVTRGGFIVDDEIDNLVLYVDGEMIVDGAANPSSKKFEFSDEDGLFTVEGGESVEVGVAVEFADTVEGGETISFSLTGVTTANAEVAGLPVAGNTLSTADAELSGTELDFDGGFTVDEPEVGALDEQLAEFDITVTGDNDVRVDTLTFAIDGSISMGDLVNFRLTDEDEDEIATSADLGTGKTVTFSELDLVLDGTETFKVFGDIVGGSDRNFTFTVDEDFESVVYDDEQNVRIELVAGDEATETDIGFGDFTVELADDSPVGGVALEGDDVVLARYTFEAGGEKVKVTEMVVSASIAGGGSLDDFKVEVNGTTKDTAVDGVTDDEEITFDFGSSFSVAEGTTSVVEITADVLEDNGFAATESVQVNASVAGITYDLPESDEDDLTTDLPGGDQLLVTAGSIDVTLDGDSPESSVLVMGSTVELGRWSIEGEDDELTLEELRFAIPTTNTIAVNTMFASAKATLYSGSEKLGEVSRSVKGDADSTCDTEAEIAFGNDADFNAGGDCDDAIYDDQDELNWTLEDGETYEVVLEAVLKASATGASAPASGKTVTPAFSYVEWDGEQDGEDATNVTGDVHEVRAAGLMLAEVDTEWTGSSSTDQSVMSFKAEASAGGEKVTLGGVLLTLSNDGTITGTGDVTIRRNTGSGTTLGVVSNYDIADDTTATVAGGTLTLSAAEANLAVGDVLSIATSGEVVVIGKTSTTVFTVRELATGAVPANVGAGAAIANATTIAFGETAAVYVPFENESDGQVSAGSSVTLDVAMDTTGLDNDEVLNVSVSQSDDVTWFDNDEGTDFALSALFQSDYLDDFPVQSEFER